ncbi:MAG: glutamate racemase [Bacteroidota bacterium]
MNDRSPIGIFDSGVGGTSIWKEIHTLMPYEHTIYLADSKNAPYGYRSKEEIIELSRKNTEYLLNQHCKIIVVACNTATTNAISVLRSQYDIPFIGIEPAIKPAALHSRTKSIGILATKGTLSSELFHKTSLEYTRDIQVTEVIGEGLVPLIEEGKLDHPELLALLKKYIQPMLDARADHIVLGCSHYPYLVEQIRSLVPRDVQIIDSGEAVARHTRDTLQNAAMLNQGTAAPKLEFVSNAPANTLRHLLTRYSEIITITEKDF